MSWSAAACVGGPLMTVLTVGLSYRSAPVSVLERLSIPSQDVPKLLDELLSSDSISEAIIVSTCNRVELYADVSRFHPALADVSALLARVSGIDVAELAEHLYVHFAEAAVEHLFSVAAGLDSMVVGESQILGQLRAAYAVGTETGSVGRVLHELVQSALRTGKTVHTDTGIDRAGASIVSVALDRAESVLGGLAGRRVLHRRCRFHGRAGSGHGPSSRRRRDRGHQPHRSTRRAHRRVGRWPCRGDGRRGRDSGRDRRRRRGDQLYRCDRTRPRRRRFRTAHRARPGRARPCPAPRRQPSRGRSPRRSLRRSRRAARRRRDGQR